MKIEELMVGNIFGYIDEDKLVPVVVMKIDGQSDIVCLRQSDGHIFNTMIDFLLPIPLTPDILEKNGFRIVFESELHVSYFQDIESFHTEVKVDKIGIYQKLSMRDGLGNGVTIVECKYVHELQQALILCRIDKKITLP